jgi:4-amino-4-deoxy-L-arabinose transferase-like glycosyltransferase
LARAIMIATVVIGFAQLIMIAIYKVLHGRGGETYENVYRLPIHWTSVLVAALSLGGVFIVALAATVVSKWRDRRDEAALIRSLEARDSNKITDD